MKTLLSEFRRRFWLPPRAHGDVIEDRTVSFLELFYDLVYVVVIGRAAHTLAVEGTWKAFGEFAVIFGLIWFGWLNGTLYYELHGREDGRTRVFVFAQMLLLALLAVFTSDAAGSSGTQFAIVYAIYMALLMWLWYTVRRQDAEEYSTATARYLTGMALSVAVMLVAAALPDGARILTWALFIVGWVIGVNLIGRDSTVSGVTATDSMAERFGLLVIIVLGEVVVGVVAGISDAEPTARSIATGLLGLMIGFAYWWTYFDFVGRRLPRGDRRTLNTWMVTHLPITLSIAAAGATMVSLVDHADAGATPTVTAWLLSGSVAVGLIGLVMNMGALQDFQRLPTLYRPVRTAVLVAILVVLLAGWLAPAPWLLSLLLVLILAVVWLFAVDRWLGLDDPEKALPRAGSGDSAPGAH